MKPLNDESRIRARVFDVIRRILDIPPVTGSGTRGLKTGYLTPPPLTAFQRIDPLLLYTDPDGWFFPIADYTPSVLWPLDVCTIQLNDLADNGLLVQRARSITPKDARGVVSRISPFMLCTDIAAEVEGKLATARSIESYLGGNWVHAEKEVSTKSSSFFRGNVAIAVALRQRYEWAVSIGFSNSPSVRIVTDPTGMKDLFRLRDVPDGRNRRDALMTWVSDHWRKDRRDPDVETYVRKHMRGSAKFDWRGMECEIMPARFDIEKRDELIAMRREIKTTGSDKRPAT